MNKNDMKTIKATWNVGGQGGPIEARQVRIDTIHGTFYIGLDNQDRIYLESDRAMAVAPTE